MRAGAILRTTFRAGGAGRKVVPDVPDLMQDLKDSLKGASR